MDAIFPSLLLGVLLVRAKRPDPLERGSWLSWPWWPHAARWWGSGVWRWIVPAAWAIAVLLGVELSSMGDEFAPLGSIASLFSGAALLAATLSLPARRSESRAPVQQQTRETGEWRLVSLPGTAFPEVEGVGQSDIVALGGGLYLLPGEPRGAEVLARFEGKAARVVAELLSQSEERVRKSASEVVELCERTLAAEMKKEQAEAKASFFEASANESRRALENARSGMLARREQEVERLDAADLLRRIEELRVEIDLVEKVLERKQCAMAA
ncbi:hypothetical protein [Verrucomicrobium sp. 3C]|uniref:hypothetical protein n=1 Tax=Verrucomicrobium sp. 3C TaxID=1134055 RepID=UPI0003652D0B|nr:hypothetical protein [Verrucomicrobium sp. 3C]